MQDEFIPIITFSLYNYVYLFLLKVVVQRVSWSVIFATLHEVL